MRSRLSVDLFFLGLLAALAGWVGHAPAAPEERARYLCAPLGSLSRLATELALSLDDDGQRVPPLPAWRFDAGLTCRRVLENLFAGEDNG